MSLYLYQTLPKQPDNIFSFSVAWLSAHNPVMPVDKFEASWTTDDYSLVWGFGEGVQLMPGEIFKAAGLVDADPLTANSSNFTRDPEPSLSTPHKGPPGPGILSIITDATLGHGDFTLGMGASGSTSLIVSAFPDMTYSFIPQPTYWIAAREVNNNRRDHVEAGFILNLETISMNAQLAFPPHTHIARCTINRNGQWDIKYHS